MESEYVEASEGSKEVIWVEKLMEWSDMKLDGPILLYEDNKACIAFSKNNTCHDRTKHIDIKAHALRSRVKSGQIDVVYVKTEHQLADIMTKSQLLKTFKEHREKVFSGNGKPPSYTRVYKVVKDCACVACFLNGVSMNRMSTNV